MGKKMKNLKLKSALLSTVALIVVGTTFTSTGSVAGNNLASELAPVLSLIENVAATSGKTSAVTADTLPTKTPIKHLIVVFNENRSFDHYFGTKPKALNVEGEPPRAARQQPEPQSGQRHRRFQPVPSGSNAG
jgi:phospholipase C